MKKRLPLAIAAGIGLAILIIAFVWSQLNRPSVGTVRNKNSSSSAPKAATWTKLDGKQFTVEYLNDYVIKPSTTPADVDSYFMIEDGLITKHLAIGITDMKGHFLDEEPAYQMRSLTPQTYRLEKRSLSGQQIPVMIRLDNTEQVAFIVKGTKLGTIALTTGDPSHPPIEEINHMISSWSWK